MRFGCHTWGFNDRSLGETLGTIARLGFEYVDIGSGPHLNVVRATSKPDAVADEFKRYLDMFHLQVSDLYLMLPRISVEDEERREHEVKSFKALMPFAAALKTPGITVSPGISNQGEDDEVFERVTRVLSRFVALAGEHDIPVNIEPHVDSVAQTPEKARALVDAVAGLGITLDWAHMVTQSIRPDGVVSLLPHTRHVQIRQAAPMRMQTPFDQGVLDMQRIITLLLSAGYNGIITIEIMQTVGWHGASEVNTVKEAVQLRDALRNIRDAFAEK